jgi:hypothetical protein
MRLIINVEDENDIDNAVKSLKAISAICAASRTAIVVDTKQFQRILYLQSRGKHFAR